MVAPAYIGSGALSMRRLRIRRVEEGVFPEQ